MTLLFAATDQTIHKTIDQSQSILRQLGDTFFNAHSLTTLVIALVLAVALGRFIGYLLRRLTGVIARKTDKTENLSSVNKLRRIETLIVLSIAVIRTLLIAVAIYFWWLFIHPNQQPTALIGASAVFAIIAAGILGPILRDLAYGAVMMARLIVDGGIDDCALTR